MNSSSAGCVSSGRSVSLFQLQAATSCNHAHSFFKWKRLKKMEQRKSQISIKVKQNQQWVKHCQECERKWTSIIYSCSCQNQETFNFICNNVPTITAASVPVARRSPTSNASGMVDMSSSWPEKATSLSWLSTYITISRERRMYYGRVLIQVMSAVAAHLWHCVKFAAASQASLFSFQSWRNRKPLSWSHLWWIISSHRTSVCRLKKRKRTVRHVRPWVSTTVNGFSLCPQNLVQIPIYPLVI